MTSAFNRYTPEFALLYNYVRTTFFLFNTVTPFFYAGVLTGHELLTYNAAKLYLCMYLSGNKSDAEETSISITLYDEANAIKAVYARRYPYWNSTAAASRGNHSNEPVVNDYFSRIVAGNSTYIKFIGLKLTIV